MEVSKILGVYAPLMVVVSCYFFPFEFTFLPKGINTKIILAVCGAVFYYQHTLKNYYVCIDKKLLWAVLIVIFFCFICFLAVDYNNTDDYSYALYIFSFATWLGGAYGTYRILNLFHEKVTFKIMMDYLIVLCVVQCMLAVVIDLVQPVKDFVDMYVSQVTIADDDFLQKVDRLYGIGATLDVAGVRFSIVLLGLSVLICQNEHIRNNRAAIAMYLLAFMLISTVGNIISRTTLVGMAMGIVYILFKTGNFILIKEENMRFWWITTLIGLCVGGVILYFYNTNEYFHSQFRFGFEGFFNWVEQGEWRTGSTDRLHTVMWIWPADIKTWLFGTGIFDQFQGTDIGYCRFVLYAGLPALGAFSLFFIYNSFALMRKMAPYKSFCMWLMVLGFIVWLKVATDVFIMYALLYCIDEENELAV